MERIENVFQKNRKIDLVRFCQNVYFSKFKFNIILIFLWLFWKFLKTGSPVYNYIAPIDTTCKGI